MENSVVVRKEKRAPRPRFWTKDKITIGEMSDDELYMLILDYTKIDPQTGCWLWRGKLNYGGHANIKVHGVVGAHRISYLLEHGSIPLDGCIRHKCDVRHCCNPKHLEHGTYFDNSQDARERGRITYGDTRLISKAEAVQIYDLALSGFYTMQSIAQEFGVTYEIVKMIKRGDSWRHATGAKKFRLPTGITRNSAIGKKLIEEFEASNR